MKGELFANTKIRNKIMLVVGTAVIISTAVIGGLTVRDTIHRAAEEIRKSEASHLSALSSTVEDIVDAAYLTIESTYNRSVTREAVINRYGPTLRSIADIPYDAIMSAANRMFHSGDFTDSVREAILRSSQLSVLPSIRSMQFGDKGYFWINDTSAKMIMHPILPELEEMDMSNFSHDGVLAKAEESDAPLFKEFVRAALADPDSGGFVIYNWPDPENPEQWIRKLSYVRFFEPWGWIIGTGLFLDQIEMDAQEQVKDFVQRVLYGDGNSLFLKAVDGRVLVSSSEAMKQAGGNIPDEFIRKVRINGSALMSYETAEGREGKPGVKLAHARLFEPWNWIIGTVVDIGELQGLVEAEQKSLRETVKRQIILILASSFGIVAAILFIALFMTRRFIERPLHETVDVLKEIAKGDVTQRVSVRGSDEIGKLAHSFNKAAKGLQEIIKTLTQTSDTTASASHSLNETSEALAQQASEMDERFKRAEDGVRRTDENIKSMAVAIEEAGTQTAAVSSSSAEVSVNMEQGQRVLAEVSDNLEKAAEDVEQMAQSINNTATAIEEMYASMNEVAKNSSRGASVASEASSKAVTTSDLVNNLGLAAAEIGEVIDLINGIASQTNLLALNAAIEAAGAGEAGKGFAVVANEVKELARQTAGATDEIRNKIKTMQANTESSIQAIGVIVEVILEINDIMSTIASAVEEQTATTNEISKNISETASRSNSVSQNVHQAAGQATSTSQTMGKNVDLELKVSQSIEEISQAIAAIAKDASEASLGTDDVNSNIAHLKEALKVTRHSADDVRSHAKTLMKLADEFHDAVARFKVD